VSLDLSSHLNDKEVWGDDVQDFRPSRFEGRVTKWDFVPFSGGPRICPAQQQVITQSVYLLVRMAQQFEMIENRDSCLEHIEKLKIMVESRNGVQVALYESKMHPKMI